MLCRVCSEIFKYNGLTCGKIEDGYPFKVGQETHPLNKSYNLIFVNEKLINHIIPIVFI